MKKLTTRQIALNGVVAGLYAAITILTASFAYGNIQFRIADSLCVLVVLEPSLTVGLTLGCLISNIFSTVSALDIVIGTAGTLLGCLLAARVKKDWLVPVPVILANAVLVGAMLAYVLTPDALVQGFFINGGEVLLGEAVVLYLLGVPLLVFYCTFGDILSNLIWCGMMIWLSFCAIRGLVYAKTQTGAARNMRYFHIGVLCFAFAEYLLWTVGCFWPDTSLDSPAFWCDLLLTLTILGLLPATRKAVAA